MVQVTTGGGHESFESPDGKLLYYEDYGVKGFRVIPTETSSAPKEGTVVLPSVRPGFWAVAEKGIYFVEFDDRNAAAYRLAKGGFPLRVSRIRSSSTTFEHGRSPRLGRLKKRSPVPLAPSPSLGTVAISPGRRSIAPNPIS